MPIRVAVVGYCASGKTTLVQSLKARGVDAMSVAQEHSIIGDLWKHSNPDVVIFLDVSLEMIRRRRSNSSWPAWIYDLQSERLKPARRRADMVVDTNTSDAENTLQTVWEYLQATERR